MNNLAQTARPLLPRHYYQVALDFSRLSHRITRSLHSPGRVALIKVQNPAAVLADWETSFQSYVRPLTKLFHNVSSQVLAQAKPVKHLDTVCALVPLEQQVYRLLTLRKIVQTHSFQQAWKRGQYLFLARIDKILSDLQHIFTYFKQAIDETNQPTTPRKQVWEKEIECCAETTAYHNWCQGKGCLTPHVYFTGQGVGFLLSHCVHKWQSLTGRNDQRKSILPLCNF